MQPTRWEITQILKRKGQAKVDELAGALGVTPMAVRLHLVVLERDGLVEKTPVREGAGRPALVYRLTEQAEEVFPKSYDALAELLIDAVKSRLGPDTARDVWSEVVQNLVDKYQTRISGLSLDEKLNALTSILSENGADATWEKTDSGYLLHESNCLYYRVAKRHPEVCSLDGDLLEGLLNVKVERLGCMVGGAHRCTYRILND